MKNLEAKQEAIKNAYGEYWEQVKDYVNENGWCDVSKYSKIKDIEPEFSDIENKIGVFDMRPKSLQGIENNNGWIKIQSEADLPKERMHEVILLDEECMEGYRNYDVIVFYEVNSRFRKKEISHYKPIEKSKVPIY